MKYISTDKAPARSDPIPRGSSSTGLHIFQDRSRGSGDGTGSGRDDRSAGGAKLQECRALLEARGLFDRVKTTCFLADIADFAAFNAVYEKYFTSKPARSCVAVKDLPKGVLCEIEGGGDRS